MKLDKDGSSTYVQEKKSFPKLSAKKDVLKFSIEIVRSICRSVMARSNRIPIHGAFLISWKDFFVSTATEPNVSITFTYQQLPTRVNTYILTSAGIVSFASRWKFTVSRIILLRQRTRQINFFDISFLFSFSLFKFFSFFFLFLYFFIYFIPFLLSLFLFIR